MRAQAARSIGQPCPRWLSVADDARDSRVCACRTARTDAAFAHGSERGFVLLLPTGYYLIGGALAVAASFVLIALCSRGAGRAARRARGCSSARFRRSVPAPTSLAAFLLLALLLAAGFFGSRDPLENPLPLAIWTLWWVGITLLHAARRQPLGLHQSLDRALPPRSIGWPAAALGRAPLSRHGSATGPRSLLFFGFAWFELVYPAPDDPERLAIAVGVYWLFAFVGMLVFGDKAWTERAEPFSIFFRLSPAFRR